MIPFRASVQALFQDTGTQRGEPLCSGIAAELPAYPGLVLTQDNTESMEVPLPLTPVMVDLFRPFFKNPDASNISVDGKACLQLDADRFLFVHPQWDTAIQTLTARCASVLGVTQSVKAVPDKLLLYEEGSYGSPPQNTETENDMFGTLIVQLPSVYTGGDLIIHLPEEERTCDMGESGESRHSYFFTAHYAELNHEVKPLTSGIRLAVSYSLCWLGTGPSPSLERIIHPQDPFVQVTQAYEGEEVLIELKHNYTEDSFSSRGIDALKGTDALFAKQLSQAGRSLPEEKLFELFLTFWERRVQTSKNNSEDILRSETEFHTYDAEGEKLKYNFLPSDEFQWNAGQKSEETSDSGDECATETTVHRHTFLVIAPRAVGMDREMRRHGIEDTINSTLDCMEQATGSAEANIQQLLELVDCTLLRQANQCSWLDIFFAIKKLQNPTIASRWLEKHGINTHYENLAYVAQISPLLSIWDDADVQKQFESLFDINRTVQGTVVLLPTAIRAVSGLFVTVCPAQPSVSQLQVLRSWADCYCRSVRSRLVDESSLSIDLLHPFAQVCVRSSAQVEDMFMFIGKLAIPKDQRWPQVEPVIQSIPEWTPYFTSLRTCTLRDVAEEIARTDMRPEYLGMIVQFLGTVDAIPEREIISSPLFQGLFRPGPWNQPTVDGVLERCWKLKNPYIKQLAQQQKRALLSKCNSAQITPWRMPNARVEGEASSMQRVLESFLRGPERAMVVTGCFTSIVQARRFQVQGTGFSLHCGDAFGSGREAAVQITKTDAIYRQEKATYEKCAKLLQLLIQLYPDGTPPPTMTALTPTPTPTPPVAAVPLPTPPAGCFSSFSYNPPIIPRPCNVPTIPAGSKRGPLFDVLTPSPPAKKSRPHILSRVGD